MVDVRLLCVSDLCVGTRPVFRHISLLPETGVRSILRLESSHCIICRVLHRVMQLFSCLKDAEAESGGLEWVVPEVGPSK